MKRGWLLLFTILIASLMLFGCPEERGNTYIAPPDTGGNGHPENVAIYIRTWPLPAGSGSSYWKANMIKGEYISELIIAFATINKTDGYSLTVAEETAGFPNIWNEVAALKAKYPHLKVNLSVGGANESGFSGMAADTTKRANFVAAVCARLGTHNLDGVDIDWEYPVRPLTGGGQRPEDRQNYSTLLRDLREALDKLGETTGKTYGLSTAVPANDWFTNPTQGVDVKTVSEIVDKFKLMTYAYYGSWSSTTGHNASLYPARPGHWSTDSAVTAYLNAQVPPEKIMLGVAFYGQAWNGVSPGSNASAPGLFQSFTGDAGTPGWNDIKRYYLNEGSGYTRYWDNTARAPYLYNGSRWVSYTDHEQIEALCNYAKAKNLGGLFVWEYGHDMGSELLQTLAANAGK